MKRKDVLYEKTFIRVAVMDNILIIYNLAL